MPPKQPPKPQMYRHDDRVESFNPIIKPKARARHAWPHSPDTHPLLTPENMALAGFYFLAGQSTVTSDTCVCFLCGVSLGGWAEDDDPHKEHLERGDCAWAETICQAEVDKRLAKGKGKSVEYTTLDDLPSSTTSTHIRENTFYSKDRETCWWPHLKNRKHAVNPQNLAKAGFVFTPSGPGSDAVKCTLCDYDVEYWDEDDDPLEQHRNKHPDCLFFTAQLSVKATAKRAPRPTKRAQVPETEIEASQPGAEPPTATATTKTHSRTDSRSQPHQSSEVQGKSKKAAPTRSRRGKKEEEIVDVEDEVEDEDEDEIIVIDDDDEEELEEVEERAPSKSTGRSTKKKGKGTAEATDATGEEEETARTKSTTKKSKSGSKSTSTSRRKTKAEPSATEAEAEGEEIVAEPEEAPAPAPLAKSTRKATKAKSKPKTKSDVETEVEEETTSAGVPVPVPAQKEKPKPRTTKAKSKKLPEPEEEEEEIKPEPLSQAHAQPTTTKTDTAKPSSSSSSDNNKKPLPSLPGRPLSQLDRFVNIPSSPVSAPLPTLSRITKPIPAKKSHSQPTRSQAVALEEGAKAARGVISKVLDPQSIADMISAPTPTGAGAGMTIEEWIKAEMGLKKAEIEREGLERIRAFEERTREARRRIVGIPTRQGAR